MNRILKRAFDLVLALAFLLVTFPFLVIIAATVKLDSPGPVLYRGRRVGRAGKEFKILKFRTMADRPPSEGPAITRGNDPRVTSVGGFLRRYKLDEIPQLLNVIEGKMSLVGPRPEDPRYVAHYTPEQRGVLSVLPGIASPAAVKFRHEEAILAAVPPERIDQVYLEEIMPEKLALDLDYVQNHSLGSDVKILIQAVLRSLGS